MERNNSNDSYYYQDFPECHTTHFALFVTSQLLCNTFCDVTSFVQYVCDRLVTVRFSGVAN